MGSWREQALIEAPVEDVWRLVGDPNRYPEWAEDFIEITGPPDVKRGTCFDTVMRNGLDKEVQTQLEVETLDDMREIQLRCPLSGWYARYVLTEAGGSTFADVEFGVNPTTDAFREEDELYGKRWYRRMAKDSIDAIKRVLAEQATRA
jgi:uncharacterized protein YndB with AHSA1/START domain